MYGFRRLACEEVCFFDAVDIYIQFMANVYCEYSAKHLNMGLTTECSFYRLTTETCLKIPMLVHLQQIIQYKKGK